MKNHLKKPATRFLLVIGALLLMVSCEKEGTYQPQKKISEIYTEESGTKQLYQSWDWDGNLLKSITYHDGSTELRFQYSGKQLYAITQIGKDNSYYLFHYDKKGQRLDSIDVYSDNLSQNQDALHYAHYDFSYNEEGLISGFQEDIFYTAWNNDEELYSLVLQSAIPGLPVQAARKLAAHHPQDKGGEDAVRRISVSFSYSGENVQQCQIQRLKKQDQTLIPAMKELILLTYTDYPSPFYKLFQSSNFESYDLYSPNLVNTCHYEVWVMDMGVFHVYEDINFTYEMEDNYPKKATLQGEYEGDGVGNSDTISVVYYYEYLK